MADTTRSSGDPVAEVLLDFQSVMAEFLDLQTEMLSAFRGRGSYIRAVPHVQVPAESEHSLELPARRDVPDLSLIPTPVVATAEPRQHEAIATDQTGFSRYTLTTRDCPLGHARATLAPGHVVVLTDDGRGVARLVAERLRSDGYRVAIIATHGNPDASRDFFVSPLDSADESDRITRLVAESCGPVAALIHLAPLVPAPPFDTLDAASWWSQLSRETRILFLLARSLGPSLEQSARTGGAALIGVTSMGGALGTEAVDQAMFPSQGGVVGFTKCVAVEWSDVRVRAVDLDPTETPEALAAHVIDELWTLEPATEIGYFKGRRVGVDVVRAPASLDPSFALPSHAVILATGGARGITAEVCLELAERYQPTFVLVGQSPLPPPTEQPDTADATDLKRALIARLQAGGARVTPAMVEKAYREVLKERDVRETIGKLSAAGARTHYVRLDVTDDAALGALIDDIYSTYGRLDGVIHGAGIIEDKLVRDKSLESFDRVLRTKAVSAFALSRHLRPESLRFLIFFSSVAGRFGNRGQADYAAANEVVSKLAVVLQQRWPGRVCSIAWAPWDKAGMVSPDLKKEFARRGVELLSPVAGRRAFWEEIQQGPSAGAEVVVGRHTPASLVTGASRAPLPLLQAATRETSSAGATRFVRLLDPSVDLYLNDHRLDGRPVLPLAFATEFMAEGAQAMCPDLRVVAVRDLQALKGIVVDSGPMPIAVTLQSPRHSADTGLTEVDVELSTPTAKPAVRYRSVVQLTSQSVEPPVFGVPGWSLQPLSKSLDRAYQDWTFHGPLFQRITGIAGIGAESVVGTIFAPSAVPVFSNVRRPEWVIDPFVFDAALQLLLMWSRAQHDKTALPSRFHSFTRFAPLSDQPLTCYAAVKSLAAGHALESTIHFVDAAGRVLAVLDTMEASCTSTLNRLAGVDARQGHPE